MTRKMSDSEFTRLVEKVGYVEACVESVRRDGGPFDEATVRRDSEAALETLKRIGAVTA